MNLLASTLDMFRALLERSPQLLVTWAGLGVGQEMTKPLSLQFHTRTTNPVCTSHTHTHAVLG